VPGEYLTRPMRLCLVVFTWYGVYMVHGFKSVGRQNSLGKVSNLCAGLNGSFAILSPLGPPHTVTPCMATGGPCRNELKGEL
jgi:hypothetical protein